jgi:hypothetical protein
MKEHGYLDINGERLRTINNKLATQKVYFLKSLLQSFIDSYFICLSSIMTFEERGRACELRYITSDLS